MIRFLAAATLAGLLSRLATVVTNDGKGVIGGFLATATAAGGTARGDKAPTYVGWGTGGVAGGAGDAAATDAALNTPAAPARTNGTRSRVTTTNTNDTYQVVGTITAGGTLAITEVGLFDGAGTGSPPTGDFLFFRSVFAAMNLSSGDSIQFTCKVQFT